MPKCFYPGAANLLTLNADVDFDADFALLLFQMSMLMLVCFRAVVLAADEAQNSL